MTPRQRVLAALSHRETDRPPIDLGGTMCSSLTGGANKKLKSFLDMETAPEEVTNPLTDSIAVSEELLRMFGVEFRTVRLKGPEQVSDTVRAAIPEAGIRDEFGTIWKKAGSA